jgi:hypothetical protein
MRSRILSVFTAAFFVLCGSAFGQFLPNLPQFDNGQQFGSYLQADVNNDGKTDIIGLPSTFATEPNFQIIVLLGNGTGGFGAPVVTTITVVNSLQPFQSFPTAVPFAIGDFNDDGKLDVAVFGKDKVTSQLAVAVLLGNGDGTFQSGKETTLASSVGTPSSDTCSYVTGDYTGDGKLDLAYGSSTGLVVLPGSGNGTFSTAVVTAQPVNESFSGACWATGDFNEDKKLDLAAPFAILLGNGNGTFQTRTINVKASGLIETVDLNGDGHLDLVTSNGVILLGDGTGHFPNTNTFETNAQGQSNPFAIVDVNGAGHRDIVQLYGGSATVGLFLNSGTGTFTAGKSYVIDGPASVGLVAADLNGDGKLDLAFTNNSGGISVLSGNGDGTFNGNIATTGIAFGSAKVAAFTGGTKPVILDGLRLLIPNSDGTFTAQNTNCAGSVFNAVGDFNRDGKLDYASTITTSNVPSIEVCLNNGNGTFTAESEQFDTGVQHGILLAGDFNGDGKLDLFGTDSGGFSILLGNGDGTFQSGIPTAGPGFAGVVALADFNHDGKLDVAIFTGGDGEPQVCSIFLGNGDGTFKPAMTSTAAGSPQFVTATDINGDGKIDLITTGNNTAVMLGKGDGTFQTPVTYSGAASTRPWIADYNLDGHPDIAFADSTLKQVFLLFNDGTGKFPTRTSYRVDSVTPDGMAVGDFNGDHKPDLVFNGLSSKGTVETMLHQ